MVTTETTQFQPIVICKDFFYGKVKEFFYELRENHTRNADHSTLLISLINDYDNIVYSIEVSCIFSDVDNIDTELMFSGVVLSDELYKHDSFEQYKDIYAFIRKRMYRAFEKISSSFSYGINFKVHVEINYDYKDNDTNNQKEKINDNPENYVEIINTEPNDVALAFYCYNTTKDQLDSVQSMLNNSNISNNVYPMEFMSKLRNMKSILLHGRECILSAPYVVSALIIDNSINTNADTESMITYRTKIGKDEYYSDNILLYSNYAVGCKIITMMHVSSNATIIDISSYIINSLLPSGQDDMDRYLSDMTCMLDEISTHHKAISVASNNENNTEVFISTDDNNLDFITNKIKELVYDENNEENN